MRKTCGVIPLFSMGVGENRRPLFRRNQKKLNVHSLLKKSIMPNRLLSIFFFVVLSFSFLNSLRAGDLEAGFTDPPDSAKPGVYWYFMDGNMNAEAMSKDLESMKTAGIAHVLFLEVNVGVPRGTVDFLSEPWQQLFKHAVRECERLDIAMTLGVGPGWTGSGGPWVKPEQSMQHLVSSSVSVTGTKDAKEQTIALPVPAPKPPFFGEGNLSPEVRQMWSEFYEDVVVLAFPTPENGAKIDDIDNKALYYRAPYSSQPGVKQFFPTSETYPTPDGAAISGKSVIDVTKFRQADGSLKWNVPEGNWTVMRFGVRNNGAITRPAPYPGLGLECDKFDTTALHEHLNHFTEQLFKTLGNPTHAGKGGLKMLHMDSWEMGAQNWTAKFRDEFIKRRKYDPQPFYPVYSGQIIDSLEVSERFLWDLRLTAQELVLENHAGAIKEYGKKYGFGLSIEPYDMNPTADLELASVADVPMCEFWSQGFGFNTSFAPIEGTSAAHLIGQAVVPAEAFTAHQEGWRQYPGSMKNQTDWAFAIGVNRLVYHTFQHQSLGDEFKPGVTMGPYGVSWNRGQTWWDMADAYHTYVARCQFMLQQGRTVADVLYLTPEGAPHVFRPPNSALAGDDFLPDRKGYNFDGCPPSLLYGATVENGEIVFPSGARYKILVLPNSKTMTPQMLTKIKSLVQGGATLVGLPPVKSPSLVDYPQCDRDVKSLAEELWGTSEIPKTLTQRDFGNGIFWWCQSMADDAENLYPSYDLTAKILKTRNVVEDFSCDAPVRYMHRTSDDAEIYFLANRSEKFLETSCNFRCTKNFAERWNPVTGKKDSLFYDRQDGVTKLRLRFEPYESCFIVFRKGDTKMKTSKDFVAPQTLATLDGPWSVTFDPKWGGPGKINFETLTDWSKHDHEGVKYYSGTALYEKTFDFPGAIPNGKRLFLDLGQVNVMARISLNGKELGTVWTAPWSVDITEHVKAKNNELKIEVVNLWANRLIGDEHLPDDGPQHGQWPQWLLNGEKRPSQRYTLTTFKHFTKDSPLLPSGLLGPVTIRE